MATILPPWRTSTLPEPLAAADRAFDDARSVDLEADRVATAARDDPADRAVGHELELGAASGSGSWAVAIGRSSITARIRWKRGNAHLYSAIVSASRAASLGVARTALTSWTPLRLALPTSTYPAPRVWPVLTPLTYGNLPISVLRFLNVRWRTPVFSVPEGESTTFLKNALVRSTVASVTRSRALE